MAVLARDLDAYQRAVEQYQRAARSHNAAGRAYQDSLLRDPNGNIYVVDSANQAYTIPEGGGQLTSADVPWSVGNYDFDSGSTSYTVSPEYGYTAMPGEPNYRVVQKPGEGGTFATRPGEFDKTMPTNKPSFTMAQARKLTEPSLAQAEAGLIGSVFR